MFYTLKVYKYPPEANGARAIAQWSNGTNHGADKAMRRYARKR